MIYKKTHTSKKALSNHIAKIEARGGTYRIKGMTIEYGWVKQSENKSVESKNTSDLIIEAATKGYKNVKVVFYPAYDEKKHKNITSQAVINMLKKQNTEIFNVVKEASDIVKLNGNALVKEMYFVK